MYRAVDAWTVKSERCHLTGQTPVPSYPGPLLTTKQRNDVSVQVEMQWTAYDDGYGIVGYSSVCGACGVVMEHFPECYPSDTISCPHCRAENTVTENPETKD